MYNGRRSSQEELRVNQPSVIREASEDWQSFLGLHSRIVRSPPARAEMAQLTAVSELGQNNLLTSPMAIDDGFWLVRRIPGLSY